MLPDGNTILNDERPEGQCTHYTSEAHAKLAPDASEVVRASAVDLARYKGILGLSCLKTLLQDPFAKTSNELDPKILISILAFTSTRDPWTTPAAKKLAERLLSSHCIQVQSENFIVYVLHVLIRPLFSKSKPDAITSTGRKAMPTSAPPKRHDVAASDRAAKPWKYETPYSISVFSWLAKVASVSHYVLLISRANHSGVARNHHCPLEYVHPSLTHPFGYTYNKHPSTWS